MIRRRPLSPLRCEGSWEFRISHTLLSAAPRTRPYRPLPRPYLPPFFPFPPSLFPFHSLPSPLLPPLVAPGGCHALGLILWWTRAYLLMELTPGILVSCSLCMLIFVCRCLIFISRRKLSFSKFPSLSYPALSLSTSPLSLLLPTPLPPSFPSAHGAPVPRPPGGGGGGHGRYEGPLGVRGIPRRPTARA